MAKNKKSSKLPNVLHNRDFSPPSRPVVIIKKYPFNFYPNDDPKRPLQVYTNNVTHIKKYKQKCLRRDPYSPPGLSSKDRNFVLKNCQNRNENHYKKLKRLADDAIKLNKIFTIHGGCCGAIRKALLERGWVEKLPPFRRNLSRIKSGRLSNKTQISAELEKLLLSNLVEKCEANFVWGAKDEIDTTIDMNKDCNTIYNKLQLDALWTTKEGLTSSMKRNHWFYLENVSEVVVPRTYISYDVGDVDTFLQDYKVTACTSLLRWILDRVANDEQIFTKTGKVTMNVIVFALNRCKEYLYKKQHRDIDHSIKTASVKHWNAFLKRYHNIIQREEVFQSNKINRLKLYLSYAKFLLKEMSVFRPQIYCEGYNDIWIVKPAYCSRGRGIKIASSLSDITNILDKSSNKYVIQKYIEDPLLIYETKFDIRQYYVVTSTYPLIIWMYRDCYLKFSSQKYNLNNFHESIHLTNNAVQRHYQNCSGRHPELPQSNMWELDEYKRYLHKIGKPTVWDDIIYPGMRKCITGIMLSCQDMMIINKNRYELYGCDFIIDKEFVPWLIEINACPDLSYTTNVTAKICPNVLTDLVKVVIDHPMNHKASTGNFHCVYRQSMTIPHFCGTELLVKGHRLPNEYFYRGPMTEPANYLNKVTGIKEILNKLKDLCDADGIAVIDNDQSDKELKRDVMLDIKKFLKTPFNPGQVNNDGDG